MDDELVAVLGAGTIGRGVAQALAQGGRHVLLVDISESALESARREIRAGLRSGGLFGGAKAERTADVLARIEFTTGQERLAEVGFVIENIPERWEAKRDLYRQIDALCPPSCIFAANTSAIPITRLASCTDRPDRVIGIHFMNPVPLKPAVEVIRGVHTSDEALQATLDLLGQIGKEAIVVRDSPGFVSNRVLMLTINEAVFLLHEGVSTAKDIDHLFKSCFGHAMGPLETADLIGLDTVLDSLDVLYDSFHDGKFRACPLLRQMVDAGLHGRKSGRGFHSYEVPGRSTSVPGSHDGR
jgi:3-hydroxybutyryl-CoA dehydrogenase